MVMSSTMKQMPETILHNPLGLSRETVAPTVKDLNQDLATTYTFYHQVKKHHWVVEGPEYMPLHKFLDDWAAALLKQADALAERITALGGYPVSGPAAQQALSLIEVEPEGVFPLRAMLEKDLNDGTKIAVSLREHIVRAVTAGDFGTEQLLKEILLEHEGMLHHLEHFLGSESLAKELLK